MALLLRVGSIQLSPKRIVAIVAASICLLGVVEAPSVHADVAEMAPQVYDKDIRGGWHFLMYGNPSKN